MKRAHTLFLSFVLLLAVHACTNRNAQTNTPVPQGPEIRGVFAGMTPCTAQARPLLKIPAGTDCDQMIWTLVLHQDPQTAAPTTYSLQTSYGLSKQGTNDLIDGGTTVSMEGKWTMTTGTKSDPDAIVYQINPDDAQRTISFLKVSDGLIHVLSQEKEMLVGNGAWSYTLNRVGQESPAQAHERPWWSSSPPTRPSEPPMPVGSSVFAVFDGRTPCHEVALDFTGTDPSDCLKIKWRLTLYQDSTTGEPGRYLYMGISTFREGSWKIVHGKEGDPDAILYQLQPDGEQHSFSFLNVDNNHLFLMERDMNLLVGNEFFSYTLSRTEQGVP
jgi:hypothetical protein